MENVKKLVQEKYGQIAKDSTESLKKESTGCGCGCSCGDDDTYTTFSENYEGKEGYAPDADLGLGCGIPTDFVHIGKGDTVIDLGSGAGNDCFVARALVGEEGKVIGIDMTKEMLELARANAEKLGYKNVQFRYGDIENMPVTSKKADVVISNCVLNLVPDKEMAVMEVCRVLKVGGHFCISDMIIRGELPETIRNAAEMYVGCVAGALEREKYMELIAKMGFINITVHKEKEIFIPDEVLSNNLTKEEIADFRNSGTGIFSITISGEKPAKGCLCCGT
jgi:ubiquinone/menaquinone biosynthesis C-methylase UbiE